MDSNRMFIEAEAAAATVIEHARDESEARADAASLAASLATINGDGDSGVASGPAADPTAAVDEPLSCYERYYNKYVMLFFMAMTNFWLFFDRGALTSMIMDIRNDKEIAGGENKSLTETEVSVVVSAYMIGFALSGPLCTALGRVVNARYIMSTGLAVCIIMTFLTGYSTSYGMLLAVRAISGFGEAAVGSYFMTMVDNMSTPKTRTLWIGVYMLSLPLGMAIGTAVSGNIAAKVQREDFAAWRLNFYIAAAMTIPFALAAMLYPSRFSPTAVGIKGKEKKASGAAAAPSSTAANIINADPASPLLAGKEADGGQYTAEGETSKAPAATAIDSQAHAKPLDALKRLMSNSLYMFIVFGMGAFLLVAGGKVLLVQPMLRFGPWKLSQTESSTLSAITAAPSMIGSLVGGIVLDRFGGSTGRRGLFRCCRHMALMISISVPIQITSLFVYNIYGYVSLQIVGTMAMMTVIAPSTAAILSSVDKDIRTYAMSYAILIERLIALPGPTIIGFMADQFSEGCHARNLQHLCEGTDAPTDGNFTTTATTTAFLTTTDGDGNTTVTDAISAASDFLLRAAYGVVGNVTTGADDDVGPTVSPSSGDGGCVWVPGKQGANGSCQHEYEARNAILFYSCVYIVCILGWVTAAVLAYRKSLTNAANAAAALEAAEEGAKEGSK